MHLYNEGKRFDKGAKRIVELYLKNYKKDTVKVNSRHFLPSYGTCIFFKSYKLVVGYT